MNAPPNPGLVSAMLMAAYTIAVRELRREVPPDTLPEVAWRIREQLLAAFDHDRLPAAVDEQLATGISLLLREIEERPEPRPAGAPLRARH